MAIQINRENRTKFWAEENRRAQRRLEHWRAFMGFLFISGIIGILGLYIK